MACNIRCMHLTVVVLVGAAVLLGVSYLHRSTNSVPVFQLTNETPEPANTPNSPVKSEKEQTQNQSRKILFWNKFFGHDWSGRYGSTELQDCPSKCQFTYDRNDFATADAIVFHSDWFRHGQLPKQPRPRHQRWVWVNNEAPTEGPSKQRLGYLTAHALSPLINWTMTYHNQSEIASFYGHFLSLNYSVRPLRPNLMSSHEEVLSRYRAALERGDALEHVMGPAWAAFVKRPHVVAWMSSHCTTNSKREQYIAELQKYIPIDKYGKCGTLDCYKRSPTGAKCWNDKLRSNYAFYLAMENNLCDDYITEKLYNPLVYGLVPVVYGGADYKHYLPPHSYINARHYHPRDLAKLLTRLHQDPVAYGRYHLWRGYMEPVVGGSLCELCHRLYTPPAPPSHYDNVPAWYRNSGHCMTPPNKLFTDKTKPDLWRTVILNKTAT